MHEPNISPLARRLAEENNVYWQHLMGTGPEGKVVEKDVIEYLHRVMAGEEAINSTPEPLPSGMSKWPEENLSKLALPGQDELGHEMQTSWQNDAIASIENLEEAQPNDSAHEDTEVALASQEHTHTTSSTDELDDLLLLNDSTDVNSFSESQDLRAQHDVHQTVTTNHDFQDHGFKNEISDNHSSESIKNEFRQTQIDKYESDFTDSSADLRIDSITEFAVDDVDDVDALLDKPVNTTGFSSESDALDYLDDDFGLDEDFDLDLDVDPIINATTGSASVDAASQITTQSQEIQPSQSKTSDLDVKDTIGTLFYDETMINESAFDAELDDLLFDEKDTTFDSTNNARTNSIQEESNIEVVESDEDFDLEALNDDLQLGDNDFADDIELDSDLGLVGDSSQSSNQQIEVDNLDFDSTPSVVASEAEIIASEITEEEEAVIADDNFILEDSNMVDKENQITDDFDDFLTESSSGPGINDSVSIASSEETFDDLFSDDLDSLEISKDDIQAQQNLYKDSDKDTNLDSLGDKENPLVLEDQAMHQGLNKSEALDGSAAEETTLSDFDIADTDFGSLDEVLDDQNFATRDGIANSFQTTESEVISRDLLDDLPQDDMSKDLTNDLLESAVLENQRSPEDKALADAFLNDEGLFDDASSNGDLFNKEIQVETDKQTEADTVDFLDDIDLDTSLDSDTILDNDFANSKREESNTFAVNDVAILNELQRTDDLTSVNDGIAYNGADRAKAEHLDDASFLSDFDADDMRAKTSDLKQDIDDDLFDSHLDDSLFEQDIDTSQNELGRPENIELSSSENLDNIADDSVQSNDFSTASSLNLEPENDIDSDIDRRFEQALDSAAEQADPYSSTKNDFEDDVFSDSDSFSFDDSSSHSTDHDVTGTSLTWANVDLDQEDPLLELERELTSELSEDLEFFDDETELPSDNNLPGVAGAVGVAATGLGALGVAKNAERKQSEEFEGENWDILEEILEDDADDIRAEQAGDVQLNANQLDELSNVNIDSDFTADFDDLEDLDLESSLNALEAELMSSSIDEVQNNTLETHESESQDALLNQMVDDSSIIDDVTASALIEEANRNVVLEESKAQDFSNAGIAQGLGNSSVSSNSSSENSAQLQNYQVARRYVELTKLLDANASIAQELHASERFEVEEDRRLDPVVLLAKAAAKAIDQYPLNSKSKTLLIANFAKEENSMNAYTNGEYIALENVSDISVASLAQRILGQEDTSQRFTKNSSEYQSQFLNCHLMVADLSVFQLDELVTSQQKPVLALGRIVHENDSYVSTLSLSGDVELERASDFLARVAYLLSDPIRLLV